MERKREREGLRWVECCLAARHFVATATESPWPCLSPAV